MIWFWIGLWVLVVLVAGVVLGLLGRMLWHKTKALFGELADASEKLAAVAAPLERAVEQRQDPDLAVFSSPGALRAERYLEGRAGKRSGGRHASDGRQTPRRERTT